MQSCELAAAITAIACGLSRCLSKDELTILSVALTQLGDTIATILTQEELCNPSKDE